MHREESWIMGSTVSIDKTEGYRWTVTFDSPPTNLVTPALVQDLHEAVEAMAAEPDLKVVVFDSANDDFWLNHFDLAQVPNFPTDTEGRALWTTVVLRLAELPFVTIAKIRGRARGGGDEFLLACDLRYASRERAIVGQIEVGTGILPGGGATERLPRLIGRDRALEAILTSYDYSADVAERYGWVTKSLPDTELDDYVDALTTRLGAFDKTALAGAMQQVNRATQLPGDDLHSAYGEFLESMTWPGFRQRLDGLRRASQELGPNLELHLGDHLADLA
jgi:enoyl-CoA hydratase/carnithine racemase